MNTIQKNAQVPTNLGDYAVIFGGSIILDSFRFGLNWWTTPSGWFLLCLIGYIKGLISAVFSLMVILRQQSVLSCFRIRWQG